MRYRTELEKVARIDFLNRHGFLYGYTRKDGVEVYINENRYKVNLSKEEM